MPVPVFIDFIAPNEMPNLVKLHIFEAAAKTGPFTEIETLTSIGVQGSYISSYTTALATSKTDWFAIQWEDDKGALTPMSAAVQGGIRSLVAEITSRIMLRDSSVNEEVAVQEAEAVVADYFGVLDPYSVDPATVSPKIKSGLSNLALARSYITKAITSSQSNKWVAGLVSLDSSSGKGVTTDVVKSLIELANYDLGRNFSIVLMLKELEVAGGNKQIVAADLSRSIIEVQ